MPLKEWIYLLNENEKNNKDIITDITKILRHYGKLAIKSQNARRIRIYERKDGKRIGSGIQFIIYTNILKTYRHLDNGTSTKWFYKDLKSLCKTYPPTALAISITYMDEDYTKEDEELRLFLTNIMKSYLGETLRVDYLQRCI